MSWVPRLLLVVEVCSAVSGSLESCSVEQVFASLQGPPQALTEFGGVSQAEVFKLKCLPGRGQPWLADVIQVPKPTCLHLTKGLLPSASCQSIRIGFSNACWAVSTSPTWIPWPRCSCNVSTPTELQRAPDKNCPDSSFPS